MDRRRGVVVKLLNERNVLFNDARNTFCCSSLVDRPLMVQWYVGSNLHGGRIELFLVPASAP